jgi:hypothetical protein
MKTYIGTKLVKMRPMNRAEYNAYRGWQLPADEDGTDDGYLIENMDGGKPNVPGHDGYVSWLPSTQAYAQYRPTDGLSFGLAIEALKMGNRVARAGWNGKGKWLIFVDGSQYDVESYLYFSATELLPWIGMKTADNKIVPWAASQTDVLADDWAIL